MKNIQNYTLTKDVFGKFTVLLIALALAVTSALAIFSTASAAHDPNPHPAQNAQQCTAAGGVFTQDTSTNPNTNTCTIEVAGTTENVAASHNSGQWTVDVTTPGSTEIYTSQGSTRTHTSVGGGDPVVTACYNSQGNPVGGFATNPNCLPA